ncbi:MULTISPECIES: hypothetical protein [unclassified Streptomyces]|uniref:hypothetical protein n=1 Tax=unclassified Streptomyces TaxID=2593676 RepID=UPI0011B93D89|nr:MULTISPECIES: hypothetical protein [unclassified Streptomyces]MYS36682.1 hypothetical protein [Streptomyces sp. SID4920]MYX69153.1 hypothetical protein [Streptomyces sp. SID8373]
MASKIARARFRLRALHPPSIPSVSAVCEILDDLSNITAAANRQLKSFSEFASPGEKVSLFASCHVLDSLGECMTELGRVNATVLNYHFRAKGIRVKHALIRGGSDSSDDLEAARKDASEYVFPGCEVANAFLEALEGELHRTAMSLTSSADSPSLGASEPRPESPGPASTAPSAPSVTASRTTKGR